MQDVPKRPFLNSPHRRELLAELPAEATPALLPRNVSDQGCRLHFSTGTMPTEEPRCPYCVEGVDFKKLKPKLGDLFECERCGHLALPTEPSFVCRCWHCGQLRRFDTKRA